MESEFMHSRLMIKIIINMVMSKIFCLPDEGVPSWPVSAK